MIAKREHIADGRTIAERLVLRIGEAASGLDPALRKERYADHLQALRVLDRQRAQQDGVDHAVNCGVGADAQSE
jgi:hypothetical protein